jgi:4,5-DOPA dioxygenase extradiol
MLPALFISHGAPTLVLEHDKYTNFLKQLSATIGRPKGIVLFSAHWTSRMQEISARATHELLYDFSGFPRELYEVQYPATGDLELVHRIEQSFDTLGVRFSENHARGLDHGAWVPLKILYPGAQVPIVALSVDPQLSPNEQYGIGVALSHLRRDDILIIGSGGTTHNLMKLHWNDGTGDRVDSWALDFEEWLLHTVNTWDTTSLFDYRHCAATADLAVPTFGTEHFAPLLYAMGAAGLADPQGKRLYLDFQFGNLSRSVWAFQ